MHHRAEASSLNRCHRSKGEIVCLSGRLSHVKGSDPEDNMCRAVPRVRYRRRADGRAPGSNGAWYGDADIDVPGVAVRAFGYLPFRIRRAECGDGIPVLVPVGDGRVDIGVLKTCVLPDAVNLIIAGKGNRIRSYPDRVSVNLIPMVPPVIAPIQTVSFEINIAGEFVAGIFRPVIPRDQNLPVARHCSHFRRIRRLGDDEIVVEKLVRVCGDGVHIGRRGRGDPRRDESERITGGQPVRA